MPSVIPVGKIVYVCDDVLEDPASGKTHVLGIFNTVRAGGADAYPYRLGRLCVFAQLTGGAGQVPVRVDIVNGKTQKVVFRSQEGSLDFSGRHTEVAVCFRILDGSFPEPGVYFVELCCGDTFIDDRMLRLLA